MINITEQANLKKVLLTASRILKANGNGELSELVRTSEPTLQHTDYNDWNGGIDFYALILTVDVDIYINIVSQISDQTSTILEAVNKVCGHIESDVINSVKIAPQLIDSDTDIDTPISKRDEPTFWKPGYFRLFMSHLASFKTQTSLLKTALERYGISAFVAHEDIEPTKEWQDEIELGLFTMEALCAILIQDFNLSKWTDQEIGVAIGRNILVVPVRRGLDPYGFIGKYQGFQAENKLVGEVAQMLFNILGTHTKTANTLISKLSELFLLSNNKEDALDRISALRLLKTVPKERVELLRQRVIENDSLRNSKVLKEFNEMMRQYGLDDVKSVEFDKSAPGQEDDLPF